MVTTRSWHTIITLLRTICVIYVDLTLKYVFFASFSPFNSIVPTTCIQKYFSTLIYLHGTNNPTLVVLQPALSNQADKPRLEVHQS